MTSWFGSWSGTSQAKSPAGSLPSLASAAPEGDCSFATGEVVEYYSSSQGKWIPAKVLKLNPGGTYDLDCKPDVPSEKIRRTTRQRAGSNGTQDVAHEIGDIVEYFGATQSRWVPAKVLKVNSNGTYDLDCKPDVTPEKIRRPATSGTLVAVPVSTGALYVPGDMVEYFSATQGKWIPAKVLSVTAKGSYDLDCKPDVQADKIRRPLSSQTRVLGSLGSINESNGVKYQVGDTVEYFGATHGKWIPAKVLKANPDNTYDLDCKPGVLPEKMRRSAAREHPGSRTLEDAVTDTGASMSHRPGDIVAYFSASQGKWIPAKVLSVTPKGTYDLDCKPDVPSDKIRPPPEQPVKTGHFGSGSVSSSTTFAAGDLVEYFGSTQNTWIPAKVFKVNPDGTYDLDCKCGVLPEKVRPRPVPSQNMGAPDAVYALGDVVEYFGTIQQRWIPAKVIAVNTDGTYSLDCKPDVPPSKMRRPAGALGSTCSVAATPLGSAPLDSAASVASSAGGSARHVSFGGDTRRGLFSSSDLPRPPDTSSAGGVTSVACQAAEPVQLLRVERNGDRWHFEVCMEGVAMLERHGQRRIAVASLCGLHKTGKSYLMNVLLGRVQKGLPCLQVGSGTSRGTDGVWLWASAGEGDENSPLLALLDCEGVGRETGDRARESHLMALCALLSSVLLLNTRGDLNEELFRLLALTCRFGDSIEERGNEAHRPVLLWLLRDFMADLKDTRGSKMTPDEYLEQTLHPVMVTQQDQDRNRAAREVEQSFLRFFRHRNCVTLAKPTTDSHLPCVETVQYSSLSSTFRSGVEQLRSQMISACHENPKSIGGQPLGCFAFVQLLRQLVAAVNDDRILNVRAAWETVQHTICGTLADELRATATAMLRALANGQEVPGGARLPLTDEALYTVLRDQRHSLKSTWEERAVGNETVRTEYWQELKETLAREEALVRVQNARLADQGLMQVLRSWQEWLDETEDGAVPVEQICGRLGGALEQMPAASLSRAGHTALQAAARRVAAARSTVAATTAQQEDLQRKAVAWGEQAAQQEGTARSQLEAMRSQLVEVQGQKHEAEEALNRVEAESEAKNVDLQEAKRRQMDVLADIEAVQRREHELKAQQRVVMESHSTMRSELEQCLAAVAKTDAERLASERCARAAGEAVAAEKQRLQVELEEAKAEVESYFQKIEQERASLKGENEKTIAEHRQKVEDVRKQLEEERNLLIGKQEKTRAEHLRMVEDARRQLEEERKVYTGTLDEHKGRLLERERGAGILEGQLQVLTSENATLRQRLDELEGQVREAEVCLAHQSQENERCRAAIAKARADAEEEQAEGQQRLRAQAQELERWLEEELDTDDRGAKPKCGCSIQ